LRRVKEWLWAIEGPGEERYQVLEAGAGTASRSRSISFRSKSAGGEGVASKKVDLAAVIVMHLGDSLNFGRFRAAELLSSASCWRLPQHFRDLLVVPFINKGRVVR
jgi:hypothetical protein